MAKRNGGIIGPDNVPAGPLGAAGGVWRLEDAFNYQKAGLWPTVLGYQIPNSVRFNSGSSDYLNKTFGTATNRKIFTISLWTKRSKLGDPATGGTSVTMFSGGISNSAQTSLEFTNTNVFSFMDIASPYSAYNFIVRSSETNLVIRDLSAWYHLVVAYDSTQATASNRIKLYLNGSQVTFFTNAEYPTLNYEPNMNNNIVHRIGNTLDNTFGERYYNGYLSEFNFIDGQALTPSSFGETDSTTGIWIPKAYTGTYGTNGFYQKYANSAALGTDSSGNGNNFTVNNLTSIDQSYDSPTNNFNTLNPLIPLGSNFSAPTEGNLSLSSSGTGDSGFFASTIIPSAGKWYFEVKTTVVSSSDRTKISIANFESVTGTNNIETGDYKGISVSTGTFGRIAVTNGATTTEFDVAGYVPVANDIMIFAVDMDNSRVYIGKNGTWFTTAAASGGDPATATGYFSPVLGNGFAVGSGHSAGVSASATNLYNFGYPPFTISSGNADANGFGNFEYAVPSGYYALCSKNLAIYG